MLNFKELRQRILTLVNTIKTLPSSREISISSTALQNAQMYAGSLIRLTSTQPSPYANDGKRKTVQDIEPFFAPSSAVISVDSGDNVELLDTLRTILSGMTIEVLLNLDAGAPSSMSSLEESQHMVYHLALIQHLTESRMWLGMELGRIRDEATMSA